MAFPFGGHPTLADYLVWARDQHGFAAQSGYAHTELGKTVSVTRVSKPGGPSLVISGLSQTERITPTQIGNFDRRLGINSPWFSVK